MSLVYVAVSWSEAGRAGPVCEALRREGYDVRLSVEREPDVIDRAVQEWDRMPEDDPARTACCLRLYREKVVRLLAVREADCFVLVEPAGNDAHYEAGFALAQDVPVVRFGRGRPGLMIFDAPVAADLDALVALVRIHVGKAALPRQLDPTRNAECGTRNERQSPQAPRDSGTQALPLVRTGQGDFVRDYPASPGQRPA